MALPGIPLIGTSARLFNCGQQLHRVPDHVVTAELLDQLTELFGRRWYACLMYADGRGVMRGQAENQRPPSEEVQDRMWRVAVKMNREIHHGGHWVVVWSSENILGFLFRDGDGDMQFTREIDDPWPRVRVLSDEQLCQMAEEAWKGAQEVIYAIDARQDQQFRAALGEKRPDA